MPSPTLFVHDRKTVYSWGIVFCFTTFSLTHTVIRITINYESSCINFCPVDMNLGAASYHSTLRLEQVWRFSKSPVNGRKAVWICGTYFGLLFPSVSLAFCLRSSPLNATEGHRVALTPVDINLLFWVAETSQCQCYSLLMMSFSSRISFRYLPTCKVNLCRHYLICPLVRGQ